MASLKQDDKSSRFFCLFPPICRRRGEIDEKGDLDSEKTADFRKILLKFKCGIRKAPALTYHQSNIVSFCLIYHFFCLLFIHIGHSDEIHVILQILNSSEMGLCNPSTTDDPKSNLSIGHLSFLLWFLIFRLPFGRLKSPLPTLTIFSAIFNPPNPPLERRGGGFVILKTF